MNACVYFLHVIVCTEVGAIWYNLCLPCMWEDFSLQGTEWWGGGLGVKWGVASRPGDERNVLDSLYGHNLMCQSGRLSSLFHVWKCLCSVLNIVVYFSD